MYNENIVYLSLWEFWLEFVESYVNYKIRRICDGCVVSKNKQGSYKAHSGNQVTLMLYSLQNIWEYTGDTVSP